MPVGVIVVRLGVTASLRLAGAVQHDLLPGLSCGRPEEDEEGLGEGLEVVVPVYCSPLLQGDLPKHLNRRTSQKLSHIYCP